MHVDTLSIFSCIFNLFPTFSQKSKWFWGFKFLWLPFYFLFLRKFFMAYLSGEGL